MKSQVAMHEEVDTPAQSTPILERISAAAKQLTSPATLRTRHTAVFKRGQVKLLSGGIRGIAGVSVEPPDAGKNVFETIEVFDSNVATGDGPTGDTDRHGDGVLSAELGASATLSAVSGAEHPVLSDESELDCLIPGPDQSSEHQAEQSETAAQSSAQILGQDPAEHRGLTWDEQLQLIVKTFPTVLEIWKQDPFLQSWFNEGGQGHALLTFNPLIHRYNDSALLFASVMRYVQICCDSTMDSIVRQDIGSILSILMLGTRTDAVRSFVPSILSDKLVRLFGGWGKSQKTNAIGGHQTRQPYDDEEEEFFTKLLFWVQAGSSQDSKKEYLTLSALNEYCQETWDERSQKLSGSVFEQEVGKKIRNALLNVLRHRAEAYIDLIISMLFPIQQRKDGEVLGEFLREISTQQHGPASASFSIKEFYELVYVLERSFPGRRGGAEDAVRNRCLQILFVGLPEGDPYLLENVLTLPDSGSIWKDSLTQDVGGPNDVSCLGRTIGERYNKALETYGKREPGLSEQYDPRIVRLIQVVTRIVVDKVAAMEKECCPAVVLPPLSSCRPRKKGKATPHIVDFSEERCKPEPLDESCVAALIATLPEERKELAETTSPAVSAETASVPPSAGFIPGTSLVDSHNESVDLASWKTTVQSPDSPAIQLNTCVRPGTDFPIFGGDVWTKPEMEIHDSAPAREQCQDLGPTAFGMRPQARLQGVGEVMPGVGDGTVLTECEYNALRRALSLYMREICQDLVDYPSIYSNASSDSLELSSDAFLAYLGSTSTISYCFTDGGRHILEPFFRDFSGIIKEMYAQLRAIAQVNLRCQSLRSENGLSDVKACGVAGVEHFTQVLFGLYLARTRATGHSVPADFADNWVARLQSWKDGISRRIDEIQQECAAYLEPHKRFLTFVQSCDAFSEPQFQHWRERIRGNACLKDNLSFFEKLRRIFSRGFVYSQAGLQRLAADMMAAMETVSISYSLNKEPPVKVGSGRPSIDQIEQYLGKLPWYKRWFRYGILIIPSEQAARHHNSLVRHLLAELALIQLEDLQGRWKRIRQVWENVESCVPVGEEARSTNVDDKQKRMFLAFPGFVQDWHRFAGEVAPSLLPELETANAALLSDMSSESALRAAYRDINNKPNLEEFQKAFLDSLAGQSRYCTVVVEGEGLRPTGFNRLLEQLKQLKQANALLDVPTFRQKVEEALMKDQPPLRIQRAKPEAYPSSSSYTKPPSPHLFFPPCSSVGMDVPEELLPTTCMGAARRV